MKKTIVFFALCALAFSCQKNEDEKTPLTLSTDSIVVGASAGTDSFSITSEEAWTLTADVDWVSADMTAGEGAQTVRLTWQNNDSASSRTATVTVSTSRESTTLQLVQASRTGNGTSELLIEEVYFTGSVIEGSDSSDDDQYIRITNNSDYTVYADGVLFVTNFISGTKSSVGAYYEYPELEDGLAVTDMYQIPGNGTDVPVAPGQSLILAFAAQNFQAENPASFDLSKADFEFYDENDFYPDTDNPDVPNLNIWFKSSATITTLHKRGFESYAIVLPPKDETAESIMTNRHWTGTYYFHFNEYNFDYDIADEDVWVIPAGWVLDAVNCSLEDSWYRNPWGAAFDAGWTHAGEYDGDATRYGKSVRRKVENGKLVDTNNSTNDFTPSATPTLAQ